jgi:hypothetical protein
VLLDEQWYSSLGGINTKVDGKQGLIGYVANEARKPILLKVDEESTTAIQHILHHHNNLIDLEINVPLLVIPFKDEDKNKVRAVVEIDHTSAFLSTEEQILGEKIEEDVVNAIFTQIFIILDHKFN